MRSISCASAALLVLAAVMPTSAQGLSEHRFLEDVLSNHPRIAAAEAELAAMGGHRRQTAVLSNPELAWEREDSDIAGRQDTWRLSWRLPFDGRKHRVAEADAAIAASQAMVDATRLDTRLELRDLFAAWYMASEREEVLKGHLDTTKSLAEWLRARAEQGEAAGVEAQRLELEVEVLDRQLAEARSEARARRASVAAWSDLVTEGDRPSRPALAPPPSAVDLSGRPDLLALEHEVAEAEARQRLARRVLAPPEVNVGWLELRDATQSFDGPVFGVSWPVPVFDRNQGNRDTAGAELDRSRAVLEAARRRARERAEAALASYSTLYGSVTLTRRSGDSDEIADSVTAAFEAGEASLTDVLDTLRTTVEAQLARLDSLAAALAAERQLEAALGRPILPGGIS
jgi:cobalt-zinc-cadmium efflux system outer membrane protein